MLTMENLEVCFKGAKDNDANFVAVKIQTEGHPGAEVIINPKENFDVKLEYYKKAYNDDLILKAFNGIKIIGLTYGDSYEDIEDDFENVDFE